MAVAAALWVVVDVWRPLPGRSFAMATGPPGEASAAFGPRYAALLARDHVRLELQATAGSAENLQLLRDPTSGVSAALVLGGAVPRETYADLVSLGAMFYEPLWLFRRGDQPLASIADLRGLRLSIGAPGSGGHDVALTLLRLNGLAPVDVRLIELAPAETAQRLESGELDAAFLSAAWDSPVVGRLLRAPGIRIESFQRADAYVARYPFLTKLRLPMGVADLAANRPPEDVTLIATRAELVVRRDLHPALQYLLIRAASEVHGGPGIFNAAGRFPAPEQIDVPISPSAIHYYRNGPSFLRRQLPFWIGEIVQRLVLVLAPLLGILYPLWSGLPRLVRWQIKHRIYHLYGELKWIERELHETPPGPSRDALIGRLAALDDRALRMHLPNAYSEMGFALKMHIRNLRAAYETGHPAH